MKKEIATITLAYLKVGTVQSLLLLPLLLVFFLFLWLAAMWEPRGYYCRSHSSARRPTTSTGSPPGAYAQKVWVRGKQQASGQTKETSWWQRRTHMPNRRSARFGSPRCASARLGSCANDVVVVCCLRWQNPAISLSSLVHSWPTLASDVPRFVLSLNLKLSRSRSGSRRSRKKKEKNRITTDKKKEYRLQIK